MQSSAMEQATLGHNSSQRALPTNVFSEAPQPTITKATEHRVGATMRTRTVSVKRRSTLLEKLPEIET